MPAGSWMQTRGAYASARQGVVKKNVSQTFSGTTMPPGLIVVPLTTGAPSTVSMSGGVLREGNSATSGSPFVTAVLWNELMGTDYYSVSATNGALANVDRSFGAGCSNADGTKIIYAFGAGNSTAIRIQTLIGGTINDRGTTANTFFTASTDVLSLVPSRSAGDTTWTVYKNGIPTAAAWTDTGSAIFGAPGLVPCGIFRHFYAGGTQYTSPGIHAYAASDI